MKLSRCAQINLIKHDFFFFYQVEIYMVLILTFGYDPFQFQL
jgi:hypothetical protein